MGEQEEMFGEELPWWKRGTKGMVRKHDPETSELAAEAVAPRISALQAEVLERIKYLRQPTSARQLEASFPEYGFSTIRKRVSELHKMGLLIADGTETESGKSPCTVYRAA